MLKHDLVQDIAVKTGIIQADVNIVLDAAMNSIMDSVAKGKVVYLKDFGVFHKSVIPRFKPSKTFLKVAS